MSGQAALVPFGGSDDHEQIIFTRDPDSGLRCIIAIYSTALGPALGGTRFFPYASEQAALTDVLRLSKAMAYKAACAGLDLGGGKAVIIGDPATDKSERLLRAYGRAIQSLGGRYVTACDVGTTPADIALVARETCWAAGADVVEGGSGDSGVMTAYGTLVGLRAAAQRVYGTTSLAGLHVAIQGVGKVGRRLAVHLAEEKARLTVADVNPAAAAWCAQQLGAEITPIDDIHTVPADIFSPNALGGVINDQTIPALRCKIVAGGANNQLLRPEHGTALHDAGILYVPDYVINAGGLIQVADELHPDGYSSDRVRHRTDAIATRLEEIFAQADEQGCGMHQAADQVAQRRIAAIGGLRKFWLPSR